ncbi:hypothetical protein GGR55DRAFT_693153 [Xylaria sp. FL0064]|nr:hypothetical protein GGR55DRAFT_693153 [Xylaria sp. FL0064]
MLPSTSPSSSATHRPTPTPTSTPISPTSTTTTTTSTTAAPTESNFNHHHPASTPAGLTAPAVGATAAAAIYPSTTASDLGAGPPTNDPSLYKRGPSSSLDGQSLDSSASLPGARDNASAVSQDQRTKKRRTDGPGSRGVANLTPEQLAKKRANDREAQRAIRERTKNQIEALENKIRELTAQKPYQELQKAIREKEAAEAQIVELKARMASIVALIQPILSSDIAGGTFASSVPTYEPTQCAEQQQHQQLSPYSVQSSLTPVAESPPQSCVNSSRHSQTLPYFSPNSNLDVRQAKIPNQQWPYRPPNLNIGGEHLKLDFLLDPSQRLDRMQAGVNGAQDSPAYQHLPMKHDWSVASHFARHDNTPMSNDSALSPPTQRHQPIEYAPQGQNLTQALWVGIGSPIKHVPATCPLDQVLLDFMQERRQRAAEGVSVRELVGPTYPSIISLLNPADGSRSHPVSKIFTDTLSKFSAICRVPEKVAVLYVMFLVMRWHISPTPENWELLPPFVRPLEIQYSTPHPAWIDYLPFPEMREKFVREYDAPNFHFEEIFVPYTLTLSLNWPYEENDALIITPDGSETIINPVFLRHLLRLDNWTLGDAFDEVLPALRGTYNLKNDGTTLNRRVSH